MNTADIQIDTSDIDSFLPIKRPPTDLLSAVYEARKINLALKNESWFQGTRLKAVDGSIQVIVMVKNGCWVPSKLPPSNGVTVRIFSEKKKEAPKPKSNTELFWESFSGGRVI